MARMDTTETPTPSAAADTPTPTTADPAAAGAVIGDDGLARAAWAYQHPLLTEYYDTEWGVPVRDERGLYERLVLEGFQAGLSWLTVLKKREAFRRAFAGFDPDTVATFTDEDVARLMADAGIIRNERKIRAAIANARATVEARADGGLSALLWSFAPAESPAPKTQADGPSTTPESIAMSKELKRRGFAFVGPTTMNALMEATGMVDHHLVGSHRRGLVH